MQRDRPVLGLCRTRHLGNRTLTATFAAAAVRADRELCGDEAELVASQGQTVCHWADGGRVHGTLQLGRPAWIAEAPALPVVADFRPRDITLGGQGAPLVGLVDPLWLRGRPGRPVALDLGGIAHLTAPDGTAFGTGRACALIDAAARGFSGGRLSYDVDGAPAGRGSVHEPLLERLSQEPYYDMRAEDVVATLTMLTARTVAAAALGLGATEVIASGGGTRNPVLMGMLGERLPGVAVRTSDALGLASAAKEAYAFAVLGFLTWHGLPGTVPVSTGARHPNVPGSVTPGRGGLRLPTPGGRPPYRMVVA